MITTEAIKMPLPSIGLWPGVDADTYHAFECMSNSRLTKLHDHSPAHVREDIENPSDPTPALILGSAFHTLALERSIFNERYVIPEPCETSMKTGERAGKPCDAPGKHCIGGIWYCGRHVSGNRHREAHLIQCERLESEGYRLTHVSQSNSHYYEDEDGRKARVSDHPCSYKQKLRMIRDGRVDIRVDLPPYGNDDPRIVLAQDQLDICQRMTDAVANHSDASLLMNEPGSTELSGIFKDADSGALSKVRLDKWCQRIATVADLKTTEDASQPVFARTIFTRGYHRQAAFYSDGMKTLGKPVDDFVFIAIEKSPPFAVAMYRLMDDVIELARKELKALKSRYAECVENNDWPAFDGITDIGIPDWAAKKIERIA